MSDEASLYLVLCLLYAYESGAWVGNGSIAFVSRWGRWHRRTPSLVGNERWGWIGRELLPPLGTLLVCHPWPLSISPSGVVSFVALTGDTRSRIPQPCHFALLDRVGRLTREGSLLAGASGPLLLAASEGQAEAARELLTSVTAAPTRAREALVADHLRAMFDFEAAAMRFRDWKRVARPLRWLTVTAWIELFVVVPTAVWCFGSERVTAPAIALWAVTVVAVALAFARAHRHLWPERKRERREALLGMVLLPPRAVRAGDPLALELLADFHPAVLACLLLPAGESADAVAATVRDARWPSLPLHPDGPAEAAAVADWYRLRLTAAITDFTERRGFRVDQIARQRTADPQARFVCPRCGTGFVRCDTRCDRCGHTPVQPEDRCSAGAERPRGR